jgi:sialic acid synthase SpsE
MLDALGVPAFKISSGEITNLPFLAHVARKGKPMILSTGMSTLDEVRTAVRIVMEEGCKAFALLHCVSCYPADPADVNLRAMATMGMTFQVPIGYSDHARNNDVALAAVALGACILEKHLTLDRSLPGPDHRASTEPGEFAALVRGVRAIQAALGTGEKRPAGAEMPVAAVVRKSLVAARAIPAGSIVTEAMVAVKRPGTGLPPAMRAQIIGRRATRNIPEGTVLQQDMLA